MKMSNLAMLNKGGKKGSSLTRIWEPFKDLKFIEQRVISDLI